MAGNEVYKQQRARRHVMKNKTRGKSEGTGTKGETKRKKRTRIPGARARGREWERKTRHEKAVVATEEKKRSGKRGFLPTIAAFQFPIQSLYSSLSVNEPYEGEEIFVLRSMRIIYFFS